VSTLTGPSAADLKKCLTCVHTVRHAVLQWCHMCYTTVICVTKFCFFAPDNGQSCTKVSQMADAAWYEFVGHLHLFAQDRCCHSCWVPWHGKPQVNANSLCWWCSLESTIFRYVGQYLTRTIQAASQQFFCCGSSAESCRRTCWNELCRSASLPLTQDLQEDLITQLCVWSTKVLSLYRTQQAAGTQEAGYKNSCHRSWLSVTS